MVIHCWFGSCQEAVSFLGGLGYSLADGNHALPSKVTVEYPRMGDGRPLPFGRLYPNGVLQFINESEAALHGHQNHVREEYRKRYLPRP